MVVILTGVGYICAFKRVLRQCWCWSKLACQIVFEEIPIYELRDKMLKV